MNIAATLMKKHAMTSSIRQYIVITFTSSIGFALDTMIRSSIPGAIQNPNCAA